MNFLEFVLEDFKTQTGYMKYAIVNETLEKQLRQILYMQK